MSILYDIDWSLSDGAISRINNNGKITVASQAENITLTARVGLLNTTLDLTVFVHENSH